MNNVTKLLVLDLLTSSYVVTVAINNNNYNVVINSPGFYMDFYIHEDQDTDFYNLCFGRDTRGYYAR